MHVAHVELLLRLQGLATPAAHFSDPLTPVVGEGQQHVVDVLLLHPVAHCLHQSGLAVAALVKGETAVGLIELPPAVAVALEPFINAGHLQIGLGQQAAELQGLLDGAIAVFVLFEPTGAAALADRLLQFAIGCCGVEAFEQAANAELFDQLVAVVIAWIKALWGIQQERFHVELISEVIAPLLKGGAAFDAVFPTAEEHTGVAFEIAFGWNTAGAAEQGNGEITQVGLGIDVAELAGDRCPEVFGELMLTVERFNRILGIGIGGIDLGEGIQQQQIDRGVLLGQDREHLEPHGPFVVVGAQQLLELGGAHR